ncbi:helix-turn-helix domain-containing protein [Shouchella shacheensis]|uniref:helix-turn-helix domain-containing protein n=1 Tax=Shouchella shacheensis TaxID=1649580 RepID=UPI0007402D15|nr:helix-turn-helix domain-containing protein [Shouchella shacheensis]
MLKKLETQFSHALLESNPSSNERALWLETDSKEVIGFDSAKLTDNEVTLLKLLLTECQAVPPPQTEREHAWKQCLLHGEGSPFSEGNVSFIHFQMEVRLDDYESFREALLSFFHEQVHIVWQTATNGVIIYETSLTEEYPDLHEVAEAIITDFYVDIHFLKGRTISLDNAQTIYSWEKEIFFTALKSYSNQTVFHELEAATFFLLSLLPQAEMERLRSLFFPKEIISDHELMRSIQIYFQNNMNVTQAAKAQHMHRNSMQYRIDKFTAKTELDLKHFPNAVITYLMLLLTQPKKALS